jgi:hypothetical protein
MVRNVNASDTGHYALLKLKAICEKPERILDR